MSDKQITRQNVETWLMQFHSNKATRAIIHKIYKNSILDIYGIARSETHHSKFLAWLFNPNESHETGELALRKLLNIAIRRGLEQNNESKVFQWFKNAVLTSAFSSCFPASNDVQVQTEANIVCKDKKNSKGRIDILVSNLDLGEESINIIIKNKIKPNKHNEQTNTYYDGIKQKFPDQKNLFLYLIPKSEWEMPKGNGPSCSCKEFIEINYQDILTEILDPLLEEHISSATRIAIEDYIHCITSPSINSKNYNSMAIDKETNEMLKKFWDANQDLILAAIDAFASYGEKHYKGIDKVKVAVTEFANNKDYTQYSINGQGSYNKRKLVEEVVARIIKRGGDVMGTLENLDAKCTSGLLRTEAFYKKKRAVELKYNNSSIYISNQWGIGNIYDFINAVHENHTIDLQIEAVKK